MAEETEKKASATIKIQYYRSMIGYSHKQKTIVKEMGFRKLNQVLERPDNLAMRGVVNKIPHLLRIVE